MVELSHASFSSILSGFAEFSLLKIITVSRDLVPFQKGCVDVHKLGCFNVPL